jgi:phosphohistidine phosphatase
MELYFLRHAKAVSRAEWERADSERPLTAEGRADTARVAAFVAKLGRPLDAIVTSPYSRARETAEIVAQHLNLGEKLAQDELVTPGFDAGALAKIVKSYPDACCLMIVGHEPDFTQTVGELTGGRIALKKGGMAYVETPGRSLKNAELVWLVQPAVLGL